ncbi:hypothetical protein GGI06_003283, partial [Coemansia sp. S85]
MYVTEDGAGIKDDDSQENALSDEDSGSDGSDSEDAAGYTSGTSALPPAIASDPFFARLLQNSMVHEANEKKAAKRRAPKRRAADPAEDDYDFDDPFIDDTELTFMGGHSHTKTKQHKKRRKVDDGNATEPEGQGVAVTPGEGAGTANDDSGQPLSSAAGAAGLDASALDDVDRYDEDDFFVYFGLLNETAENTDEDTFEAPAAKKTRVRKRAEKKPNQQPVAKEGAPGRKRANGAAAGPKGGSTSDAGAAKRKPEAKSQHRRNGSDSAANAGLIPTNGRKSGARTSRKLDQTKSSGALDGAADSAKQRRPPVPERDKPTAALTKAASTAMAHLSLADHEGYAADDSAARGAEPDGWAAARRGGTPTVSGGRAQQAAEAARVESEARMPTREIEAAMEELAQAAKTESFSNRQRFPSALKAPLRLVCELCMARALEYDRLILSLNTPEQTIYAWSTPMDTVGFTTDIYDRIADVLPYNRATTRKIVSKLLGPDLISWKERQLKQIEDGLKLRIDDQIKNGVGWIPVTARAPSKEGAEEGASAAPAAATAAGGSPVRWHWTTISKHILFQFMLLTLNTNELRSSLDPVGSKDGLYREQQARKDAYAHLAKLWPGSSMPTYEVSRAYSSRKSLLEKQNRKSDSG